MLRFKKIPVLFSVLFMIAFTTACIKKDFDTPPIDHLPVGEVYSIAELKHLFDSTGQITFDFDASVYGVVTMDETSGNIYRSSYIQDDTYAINLRLKDPGGLRIGDSIRVYLRDVTLSDYNGLLQLDNVHNDSSLYIIANQRYKQPETVSLEQLTSGTDDYKGKLVRLENVQFVAGDLGKTFADPNTTTNRNIEDCEGNSIIVRTSSFANFATKTVPEGNGSMIGIAGFFGSDYQLYIRTITEVDLSGARCEDGGGGGEPGDINPIDELDESFDAASNNQDITFTGWTNFAEAGNRLWQGKEHQGNLYAQATGFNSGLSSMVTWLITPPVTMNESKTLRFKTAKAFWEHNDNTGLTVWASTNYDGANIGSASWTQLDARIASESDSDHAWIESGDIDLSSFMDGEYVFIAFKYRGSDTESTSYRLDDVYIGTDENGGGGGGGEGGGTFEEPFNIAQSIDNQNATPYVTGWSKGYIVGTVKEGVNTVTSSDDLQFSGPFSRNTNVLLADDPNETDYTKILAVNLPAGSALRDDVNLVGNPDNLGKWLNVYGVLRAYFGIAGLRDMDGTPNDFELENGNGGGGGNGVVLLDEDFQDIEVGSGSDVVPINIPGWTNTAVVGTDVWEGRGFSGDQFAQFTSYYSDDANNEVWLITPGVNLNTYNNEVLTFETAIAFYTHDALSVYISTDFSGNASDISSATWIDLEPNLAGSEQENYDWVHSGQIDLSNYSGTAYIAFRYVGSNPSGQTGTYRVNNVLITAED